MSHGGDRMLLPISLHRHLVQNSYFTAHFKIVSSTSLVVIVVAVKVKSYIQVTLH